MIPQQEGIQADVGVIVGRFQVPDLHPGHLELLKWVQDKHSKVIVLLGCTDIGWSANNPLDFEARSRMIQAALPQAIVLPLYDTVSNDVWSASLDLKIQECMVPTQTAVLYGSRDSFIPYYTGRYATQELVATQPIWSGTQLRDGIRVQQTPNRDFRAGVIWRALNEYPRVVMCVDIACFDDHYEHVTVITKKGSYLYQFPGGFCEPGGTFLSDARRECHEEVLKGESTDYSLLGLFNIDDSRFRGEPHKMRTAFYTAKKMYGTWRAGDDADTTHQYKMPLDREDFIPEHHQLVEQLNQWWAQRKDS